MNVIFRGISGRELVLFGLARYAGLQSTFHCVAANVIGASVASCLQQGSSIIQALDGFGIRIGPFLASRIPP